MENSRFQFQQPVLKELVYRVFEEKDYDEQTNIKGRIEPSISRLTNENSEEYARVSVCITIGEEDASTPFFIKAVEEAFFRWEKDGFTEEQLNKLLNQNAVALLISYVRPIISTTTANSRYQYNLPYINLT